MIVLLKIAEYTMHIQSCSTIFFWTVLTAKCSPRICLWYWLILPGLFLSSVSVCVNSSLYIYIGNCDQDQLACVWPQVATCNSIVQAVLRPQRPKRWRREMERLHEFLIFLLNCVCSLSWRSWYLSETRKSWKKETWLKIKQRISSPQKEPIKMNLFLFQDSERRRSGRRWIAGRSWRKQHRCKRW